MIWGEAVNRGYLFEDEVSRAIAQWLAARNAWRIRQLLQGNAPGIDIIMSAPEGLLMIEAKGCGSQRPDSRRAGLPFTKLQCRQSWDAAYSKLPEMAERGDKIFGRPIAVGLALPNHPVFRDRFELARSRLSMTGDGVWFVGIDGAAIEALAPNLAHKHDVYSSAAATA